MDPVASRAQIAVHHTAVGGACGPDDRSRRRASQRRTDSPATRRGRARVGSGQRADDRGRHRSGAMDGTSFVHTFDDDDDAAAAEERHTVTRSRLLRFSARHTPAHPEFSNTLPVPSKHASLLCCSSRRPTKSTGRRQLLQEVWGYDFFGGPRTVDVHVRRLRQPRRARRSEICRG